MYDTIYAHQDKADDARAGVHSAALGLGDDSRAWLALFSLGCVGSLAVAGAAAGGAAAAPGVHVPALGAGLACGAAHLAWQLRTVDFHNRADCLRKFQSNHHFGAIIFAALVVGRLLAEVPAAHAGAAEAAGTGVSLAPATGPESTWSLLGSYVAASR